MIVFLDTETGGLDPQIHPLIEVAWARDDDRIVREMVVQHDLAYASEEALAVNRYHERGLDSAPVTPPSQTGPLWTDLLDATIVGANPAFDAGFLTPEFRRYSTYSAKVPWHYRLCDIEAYAAGVLGMKPPLLGLRGLADLLRADYGADISAPDHTAAGDVRTLMGVWDALQAISRWRTADANA